VSTHDLDGPLLASVSRSFFLSIRLLPARLRSPVALAYLLARASDTMADSSQAPAAEREQWLDAFGAMIEWGGRDGIDAIRAGARSEHEGENHLIAALDRILAWFESLGEFDRAEIRRVMALIIRGQRLDVQRFSGPGVHALATAQELEEYTYLVAGCVGEFWTRTCLHHLRHYSSLAPERLTPLGIQFGQALQMVNILRDLPADLRQGRCYLPAEEVDAARLLNDPALANECFARWLARARVWLESGRDYIASLRPARVRAGCFLPWSLAGQTLDALEKCPPLEAGKRVKVSRAAVRATLLRAAWASVSNAPLRR
jgi:farnesyl-diphosphate farnesyltransferase